MIIMGLDVATKTGWAIYDTDCPPSAIESGSIKLVGSDAVSKSISMRQQLPEIIRTYHPTYCVIEKPLSFIPRFKKKSKTLMGVEETETTINANTIMQLNHLAGAAQMAVMGFNVDCEFVAPKTWQSIIPKHLTGDTKARAKSFCELLSIVSPNMDSRDAAIIAVWAAGHAQKIKLMERAA